MCKEVPEMKGEMRPLYSKRLGRRLIQIESSNRDTSVSLCEMLVRCYIYIFIFKEFSNFVILN